MDFSDFVFKTKDTMSENQKPSLCREGRDQKWKEIYTRRNQGIKIPTNNNFNSSTSDTNLHNDKGNHSFSSKESHDELSNVQTDREELHISLRKEIERNLILL